MDVGARTVQGGLIYVGQDLPGHPFRSTIDPSAKVATRGPDPSDGALPYWPSYLQLTPANRLAYLDWLDGPREGGIGLGIAFLYFYGLERRAMKDEARDELSTIRAEAVRLLKYFGEWFRPPPRRIQVGFHRLGLVVGGAVALASLPVAASVLLTVKHVPDVIQLDEGSYRVALNDSRYVLHVRTGSAESAAMLAEALQRIRRQGSIPPLPPGFVLEPPNRYMAAIMGSEANTLRRVSALDREGNVVSSMSVSPASEIATRR